jgi:hypothetical protein
MYPVVGPSSDCLGIDAVRFPTGADEGTVNYYKWLKEWWAGTGLNRRHQDFQSCALPTELPAQSRPKRIPDAPSGCPRSPSRLRHVWPAPPGMLEGQQARLEPEAWIHFVARREDDEAVAGGAKPHECAHAVRVGQVDAIRVEHLDESGVQLERVAGRTGQVPEIPVLSVPTRRSGRATRPGGKARGRPARGRPSPRVRASGVPAVSSGRPSPGRTRRRSDPARRW